MRKRQVCPQNQAEVENASMILGCKFDEYGNNQYICLPNEKKTSLVEICYKGYMGLTEKGNCLVLSDDGSLNTLNTESCKHFLFGCPNEPFSMPDYFKYKGCLAIDTKHNCYILDPACPPNVKESFSVEPHIIYTTLGLAIFALLICIAYLLLENRKLKRRNGEDSEATAKSKLDTNYNEGRKSTIRQDIGRERFHGICEISDGGEEILLEDTGYTILKNLGENVSNCQDTDHKDEGSVLSYAKCDMLVPNDSQSRTSFRSFHTVDSANSCNTGSRGCTTDGKTKIKKKYVILTFGKQKDPHETHVLEKTHAETQV